ncbi:MAG: DUF882 domain-containing protein [Deltaproteobacteria bacterium]|nr:MAG: DUF882 domain-containing protein [Deltaproteobacteria bacterium]
MTFKKLFIFFTFFFPITTYATQPFYLSGDGKISLTNPKTNQKLSVTYFDHNFSQKALSQINSLFGIKSSEKDEWVSPRLISLLDFLQDHFSQGMITIVSGYRSPEYNEGLRKKGRQAAMTSLHIEGMASDINIEGVEGKDLWVYVRNLECCGAGYYQGKGIHIDTGPVRFWDQTSTKVKEKLGARNKLIIANTDKDFYTSGEKGSLILARITDYPIMIHKKGVIKKDNKVIGDVFLETDKEDCVLIKNRHQARNLFFTLTEKSKKAEKAKLEFSFCEKAFPEMKDSISSNPFSITK